MASQEQDLVIYNDNSIVSDKLFNETSTLTIVSYVDGTQPTWLTNCIIENSLAGTATLVNKEWSKKTPKRCAVKFISFVNNKDFYVKGCKKNGLDLSRSSDFEFNDFFTDLFTKHIKDPQNAVADITRLFEIASKSQTQNSVIILECPEILLTSTNITSNELLNLVHRLNKSGNVLYVISNHNHPQFVDLAIENVHDPVYELTDFLTKLHYRASLNICLAPLATGRANDITGTLSIVKGPVSYQDGFKVSERNYKYHISKDSSIKLFFS